MGCSPTLDWRNVQVPGSDVVLQVPCRPSSFERKLELAATPVVMGMQVCRAGDVTWAVSRADVVDPARVGPALLGLRQAAVANVEGQAGALRPWQRPGFTPNPEAGQVSIEGRLPGQAAVVTQVAVFAVGTVVFQVSAVGPARADDGELFFSSIRRLQP